jgi:2-polyprenyl-6-methoxyphenol hydroxylase-like FAD-dependent oxidoreductase
LDTTGTATSCCYKKLLTNTFRIKSISFDRHPPSDTHPRAAGLNYRTSEILRQLGLEQLARDQSAKEFDIDAGMLVVEKLVGGKTLAHLQENDPKEVADVTPCRWLWITQAMFEPLLRANGAKFGCTQVYNQLVVHYEEDDDGVLVVVQDLKTKELKKYRSKYLVACDGNRSGTRIREGISFDGDGTLRNSLSIRVSGDLSPYLGTRSVYGVIYVNNTEVNGGFRLENQGQSGIAMINRAGGRNDFPAGSVTLEQARQYVQSLSGLPDDANLKVESVSYWTMTSYVANRLQSHGGRVFIAGDAAHTMPPTGGLGGNTGIGVSAGNAVKRVVC